VTAAVDPVAAHIAELDRLLRGPGAVKRSMIAEVRDGLHDAAAAYRAGGLDPESAAATAVRDFGTVREVAPLMQEELTARQGRSTALLLAVTFPALLVGWDLLWMRGVSWWSAAPDTVAGLARLLDVTSAVVAAVALALLVGTSRRSAAPRWITALAGITAVTGAVVSGGTSIVMNLASWQQASQVLATEPLAVVARVASGLALVLVVRSAVRSLRVSLAPGRSDQRPDVQVR
jgi:hypothetical protein